MSSNRDRIAAQFKEGLDDKTVSAICDMYRNGIRDPLVEAVRRGDELIWRHAEARELIADTMLNAPKKPGRPRSEFGARDFEIMHELFTLQSQGIPVYGDSKNGERTACEIVGDKHSLSAESVQEIWKKQKNRIAFAAAYKKSDARKGGKIGDLFPPD